MSDPRIIVDPQQLDAGSTALLALSRRAEGVRHAARRADALDRRSWGALGDSVGVPFRYERLTEAVDEHLAAVAVLLDTHSDRLRAAATRYRRQDQATAARIDALYAAGNPTAHAHPDTAPEPSSTEPSGTGGHRPPPDAAGITAEVAAVGGPAGDGQSPFEWLAGSRYACLLDFTEPLQTIRTLVAGEPARIAGHAGVWRQVADDLRELAADLAKVAGDHLADWQGTTGDRARDRLRRFARDLRDTAATLDDLVAVLDAAATLIAATHGLVTDRIVELLSELIEDWGAAAALDATVPGAEAVAAEETVRKTSLATLDCVAHARRTEEILGRIAGHLAAVADSSRAGTARYRRESGDARALLVTGRYLET